MAKKKAALHNLGCKVNSYEMEAMRQSLEKAGYEIVPFESEADVYVINTCTVTNIADRKSRQMLHRAKKMNPDSIVVAAGCYAQVRGKELEADPAVDAVIGSSRKHELGDIIEKCRESGKKQLDINDWKTDRSFEKLGIDRTEEHTRAFIKVQDGCSQYCTYCIIPYARGGIRSRNADDVTEEIKRLAESGVQEVVLTGIHICSYGKDTGDGTDLLDLIGRVSRVDGIRRIRLGSLEPGYLENEEVVAGMAETDKLCPHFHLSLQSGCGRTLRAMNRHYTPADFEKVVNLIRKYYTHPALCTDIITGFPGETEEDFRESLEFVRRMNFFETHIFPYSRRNGTPAAKFSGQNTEAVKHERGNAFRRLDSQRRKEFLKYYIGRDVEALFEEQTEVDGRRCWVGHGREYQKVLLSDGRNLSGKIMNVRPVTLTGGDCLLCM